MTPTSLARAARLAAATVGTAAGLTALAWFVLTGSLGGLSLPISAALIYLLPLVALQVAADRPLRRLMAPARFPVDWVIFVAAKLIIAGVAAGAGSVVMLLAGLARNWSDLYITNRMVVVVTVLFACAIRLHGLTRTRLEERNRQLADKIEAERHALELHRQDAERAREIQQALMPHKLPQVRRLDLAAGCRPALTVGGDYFDAIRLGDGAAIAIADVSGKGMAAALLMSNLQAIVRAFAPGGPAPHDLCAKANRLIAGNVAPGKYITFFYAVIEPAGSVRLQYCNAGHNPPVLLRRDGSVEALGEGGPVLGIFPDAVYSMGAADLAQGDCLALYTDGITEALNGDGEEFGEHRLVSAMRESAESAEQLRRRIMKAVTGFCSGAFHDDATLVVVRIV